MKTLMLRRSDTGQLYTSVGKCRGWTEDHTKAVAFRSKGEALMTTGPLLRTSRSLDGIELEIVEFTMIETGTVYKVPAYERGKA